MDSRGHLRFWSESLGYTITGADNGGQAFWDLCIEVDPADADIFVVASTFGKRSTAHWACPCAGEALDYKYAADRHDIVFMDNGDVLLANDGGVFEWSENKVTDKSRV